ncbi:hypothetical protein CcrKarma_gp326 [Caulobacter virus Karma]|uniref:hypothetical protein n=1 Tax=Caulobacter virus Karma TaxID=1211641 RepID=UPI00028AE387|nr:hypothetical protein CcrKarma_gp326 [Caulobacter virus Karma]AFU87843.1 hypothetical protein CcrKarma_gp326 [Caulobacter virus Karma]
MPRGPLVEKYVKGKLYSQRQFRRLIIDTLRAILDLPGYEKGARARDIADKFGDPAWVEAENLRLIAVTLNNLKTQGLVKQIERGLYKVNEAKVDLGLDQMEQTEQTIAEVLRAEGGYAKRRVIDREHDADSQSTDVKAGDIQRTLTRVLMNSQRIQKAYGGMVYAFYNLPQAELSLLPQMGKWLHLQSAAATRMLTGQPSHEVYGLIEKATRLQYRHIGAVFKFVIDHIDEDFADAARGFEPLHEAMAEFNDAFSDVNAGARNKIEDRFGPEGEDHRQMREAGKTYTEIDDAREAALRAYDAEAPLRLIDLFCEGNPQAHERAPLSFYEAFADWAMLDAAQLSRGILVADFTRAKRIKKLDDREDGPLPGYEG